MLDFNKDIREAIKEYSSVYGEVLVGFKKEIDGQNKKIEENEKHVAYIDQIKNEILLLKDEYNNKINFLIGINIFLGIILLIVLVYGK